MLGLVICALVLSLAYPLKQYLVQRGNIVQLERQRQDASARVAALEKRKQELSDPAYINAQARRRLHYVYPGETAYVVVTPSSPAEPQPSGSPAPHVDHDASWYERLWQTVRTADGAPAQ